MITNYGPIHTASGYDIKPLVAKLRILDKNQRKKPMYEPEYIAIAKKMLNTKSLPIALVETLNRLNTHIKKAKPEDELRSTQVIAVVVEDWIKE